MTDDRLGAPSISCITGIVWMYMYDDYLLFSLLFCVRHITMPGQHCPVSIDGGDAVAAAAVVVVIVVVVIATTDCLNFIILYSFSPVSLFVEVHMSVFAHGIRTFGVEF